MLGLAASPHIGTQGCTVLLKKLPGTGARSASKGRWLRRLDLPGSDASDADGCLMPETCGHCTTSLAGQPSAGLRRHQFTKLPQLRSSYAGGPYNVATERNM